MKKRTVDGISKTKSILEKTNLIVGLSGAVLSVICGFCKVTDNSEAKGVKK